jgi:hypothetical protein
MVCHTRVRRCRHRGRAHNFDVSGQGVILDGFEPLANLDRCSDRSQNNLVPGDNGHLHLWRQFFNLWSDRFGRRLKRLQSSHPNREKLMDGGMEIRH